ncbi:hypothetical protein [Marinigracilibium pacificum]|uniref:Uncharacterized protein n=1 Tax=Marinigracilibium pacificum TaxID=2729599 RepID=A0A848IYR5_9BACT|nr:hypothetical protein [Marinigracilibium pacificum]NMM47139.1 hypothetical protein [Marinigracilibium pacificum]
MARYYIILALFIFLAGKLGLIDGFVADSAMTLVFGITILEQFSSIRKYKKSKKLKPLLIVILAILLNALIIQGFEIGLDSLVAQGIDKVENVSNLDGNVFLDNNIFFKVLSMIIEVA